MSKISGVYSISCTKNNKVYIGQSCDVHKRWGEHKWALRCGVHKNKSVQASYSKYGDSAFVFQIIEECKSDSLGEAEQRHLDAVPVVSRFNFGPCGSSPQLGAKRSPEQRERMSRERRGKKASPHAVLRRNEKLKSVENRVKMSRKYGGGAVVSLDLDGSFLKEYETLSLAAEDGFRSAGIRYAIRDQRLYRGRRWRWRHEKQEVRLPINEVSLLERSRRAGGTPVVGRNSKTGEVVELEFIAMARTRGWAPTAISHVLKDGGTAYGFTWEREAP